MSVPDVSILIVHYNTPGLLRQTLKGIYQCVKGVSYEVLIVDNNPQKRLSSDILSVCPSARILQAPSNEGFSVGMNRALREAKGQHILVFNPDIAVFPEAIETLVTYLREHPQVGIVAPALFHPDRSLQYSCFRFMSLRTLLARRVPAFRRLPWARQHCDRYFLKEWDHAETRDVPYVLGACMLLPRQLMEKMGGFDAGYFMYFEDQDLCRRVWQKGYRVVYHPRASMVHYHRRETAEGGFFGQLLNPLTWIQTRSALRYFWKFRKQPLPSISFFS